MFEQNPNIDRCCNGNEKQTSDLRGPAGPPNVLTIGTVTESETETSAEIVGDSPNQVLNLILRKGKDGKDADPVEPGKDGKPGNYPELRYAKNGSASVPPALVVDANEPLGWTTSQPSLQPSEYLWMTKATRDGETNLLIGTWNEPIRQNPVDAPTMYTWIRYSANDDGVDMTPTPNSATKYIGISYNNATELPSDNPEDYTWSPWVGAKGETGPRGPFPAYRGPYNTDWQTGEPVEKQYYGGPDRVEIVKYNGNYYITRVDAGVIPLNTLPTNPQYWNASSSEPEIIATGFIFGETVVANNLWVRNLSTSDSGERIELRADTNSLKFTGQDSEYDYIEIRTEQSGPITTMFRGNSIGGKTIMLLNAQFLDGSPATAIEIPVGIIDLGNGLTIINNDSVKTEHVLTDTLSFDRIGNSERIPLTGIVGGIEFINGIAVEPEEA